MANYKWIHWLGLHENYQSLNEDEAKALTRQIAHELADLEDDRDEWKKKCEALVELLHPGVPPCTCIYGGTIHCRSQFCPKENKALNWIEKQRCYEKAMRILEA